MMPNLCPHALNPSEIAHYVWTEYHLEPESEDTAPLTVWERYTPMILVAGGTIFWIVVACLFVSAGVRW